MFRRIEEVVQEIQDTRQHGHSAEELSFLEGAEGSVHGPEPPVENKEKDEALINLRKFRRIQLIDKSLRAEMDRAMPRRLSMSTSRLGSKEVDYGNIDYSGAGEASASIHLNGAQLGFQQWATATANFSIGAKQTKHYIGRDGPFRNVLMPDAAPGRASA
jgi:hypothetical protein